MKTPNKTSASGPNRRTVLAAGALIAPGSVTLAQADTSPAAAPAVTAPPSSAAAAAKAVSDAEPAILRISREVWENAELSRQEMKSHAIHIRELEAAGFTITSRNTSGYPTAFIAEWKQGSSGPVIAYLPEYDALPGLGNAAEPRQTAGPTGVEVGHACGHNLIGAGCTGAALALKRMMMADGTPGTIRVYGCASEESQGVKVYMVRDGLFDDVDAALAWHPAPIAATGAVRTAANNGIRIIFRGRTAHAGNSPWDGRSALDAAELFGHAVNQMREHVLPTARLHYIYQAAGVAPNVVPVLGEITTGGGSDVGDINWVVPTALFGWPSLPLGVSLHTWPVTACGGMSIGDKASLATAKILAGAGHDLMTQPALLAAAKADFVKRKGDTKYVSPLSADKKPEILPAYMHKEPGDDTLTPDA